MKTNSTVVPAMIGSKVGIIRIGSMAKQGTIFYGAALVMMISYTAATAVIPSYSRKAMEMI